MRIIKEGDLAKKPKPITFTCVNCGCVFEAQKGEYDVWPYALDANAYACNCPNCKEKVITHL